MTTSSPRRQRLLHFQRQKLPRLHLATLVMLGVVALSAAIAAAWLAGEGTISAIFEQLNSLQENPPLWAAAPMMVGHYLLFWTVALMLVVLIITKVSPRPATWSRTIVAGILVVLSVRYLMWRSLTTLNLSDPLNGVFSLGLFFLELLTLFISMLQLFLMLRARDRRKEADQLSVNVFNGAFTPTVDILIPTYNEPAFILRRTVMGCQALEYGPKKIYLLDDTRRPQIKALAAELGCEYRTRPDNRHAKAGNLNYAIPRTNGELIVVFDADFVPTKNFLTRTVGFFQDPQTALVQTPQSFYNPDPIARNLGLENVLPPEEEVFYRQVQRIRDGAGSVVCSGTSFVVRRSALLSSGCFVTDSLSEDFFTGIRLAAKGYRLVYLNEKLSAGLAAENIASHALQRIRWAQGTLQAFFIKANPLTIPGLRPIQRLAYLEGLLHWFTSISRVGFLLMPLAYSFLGVIPLQASGAEILFYFLPYYLVQLTAFSWLNYRSRSALLSDVYSLALCFPLAITAVQSMLTPFSKGFRVTPKGTASDRFSFNWHLAWPLVAVFIATAISLWINLGHSVMMGAWQPNLPLEIAHEIRGVNLGWIWSVYNLGMLGIVMLILLDVPNPDPHEWFNLQRTVKLQTGDHTFWGFTTMISEVGAEVALTQAGFPNLHEAEALPLQLELMETGLNLQGHITRQGVSGDFPTVRILFDSLNLRQQRCLTEMLFCRPGQWKNRCTPGEFHSLWLLIKILLKPRVIFNRKADVSPVAVTQV